MKRELTCIGCPMGCALTAELDEGGKVISVMGNICPKGEEYAKAELTHPTRVLTSSVRLSNREGLCSVKTAEPISKEQLFAAMKKVKQLTVSAPVCMGQVILKDVADGVDLIATKEVQ